MTRSGYAPALPSNSTLGLPMCADATIASAAMKATLQNRFSVIGELGASNVRVAVPLRSKSSPGQS
jgi:hypothetical protein